MSFAARKNQKNIYSSLDKNKSTKTSQLAQSRTFTLKSSGVRSIYGFNESNQEPPGVRLEKIEMNLSKLGNKNDVLLPLLNMTTSLPIFSKNENEIKEFQKKLAEHEKILSYFDEGFEKYKEYFVEAKYNLDLLLDEKFVDNEQLEKQLKLTNNHLNALHSNLKDVEITVLNLQNLLDKKFNEETKMIKETAESKLKKSKKDIQTAIKDSEARINQVFKEHEENLIKYAIIKVGFLIHFLVIML